VTRPVTRLAQVAVAAAAAVVVVATGAVLWSRWQAGGSGARRGTPTASLDRDGTAPTGRMPSSARGGAPVPTGPFPDDPTIRLLRTEPPARDLVALARRMGRTTGRTDPPVGARSWQRGDTAAFWVHDIDGQRYFTVTARLAALGEDAYLWVEEGQSADDAALQRGADTFSHEVMPRLREVFGSEPSPGIDGDRRVYILHHQNIPGVAGYFSSSDLLPPSVDPYSNRHEMFYVNLTSYRPGSYAYLSLLAHEFQHMIHYHHDPDESVWINEGLSDLAAEVAGYAEQHGDAFFASPDTSLMLWAEDTGANATHYAAAYAFCAWLRARYGDDVLRAVVAAPGNGPAGVEQALAALGKPAAFDTLFLDWAVANLVHDNTRADAAFSYGAAEVDRVVPEPVAGDGASGSAEPYGTDYLDVTGQVRDGRLALSFEGDVRVGLLDPYAPAPGRVWWSNVGESMDGRLTRTFDLSGAASATLTFRTWYDLEYNWDYAYILASTDAGRTWQRLATDRAVDDDPNGNNYGRGITGSSGGWTDLSVDLTPLAGRRVTVCIEVVTDDAVSLPGMAVDDIRLDAAGFHDDAESDAGWTAEGWVRIDPTLPQRWGVQAIVDSATGTRVERFDAADGRASIVVGDVPPDATVTLAISPMTPVTRNRAGYRVGVAR
jgi:immune inhibitor A